MVPDIPSQQPTTEQPTFEQPAFGRPSPAPPAAAPPARAWPTAAPPAARSTEASSTREDLRAVIGARRDLGPEYEDALVDSFLDKLDVEIVARVRNEVAAQTSQHGPRPPKKDSGVGVALGSLGIGIPLTGIAAGSAGTTGLVLAWGGIVAVNLAYALSRRSQR